MKNAEIVAQWSCVDFPYLALAARLSCLHVPHADCDLLERRLHREQLLVAGFAELRWAGQMAVQGPDAEIRSAVRKYSSMAWLSVAEIDVAQTDLLRIAYASRQICGRIDRAHFTFGSVS